MIFVLLNSKLLNLDDYKRRHNVLWRYRFYASRDLEMGAMQLLWLAEESFGQH